MHFSAFDKSGTLFHAQPPIMYGNKLVPLASLKELNYDAYANVRRKYEGRMNVLETVIPILNCRWDEVIFLSPIAPITFAEVLTRLQYQVLPSRYFAFDPYKTDLARAVTLTYDTKGVAVYKPFDQYEILYHHKIPKGALRYYITMSKRGVVPFLHHLVPQVLYPGELSVAEVNTTTNFRTPR